MVEIPDCTHRSVSPEAYRIDLATGQETRITLHLCEWPEAYPDRLIDAPLWVHRAIGGGLAIKPERDCIRCPARATLARPDHSPKDG